jgi:Leucine-rich repeat (LRR) protein
LKFLLLTNNNILDISNTDFLSAINPTYLYLSGSRIRYLDNFVFGKKGQLETLVISGNMLGNLGPGIFSDCTNLRYLYLSANRISVISISAFYVLEYLEQLHLSNNDIGELNPRVFDSLSFSINRQNHQLSNLRTLTWLKTTYGLSTSNSISR